VHTNDKGLSGAHDDDALAALPILLAAALQVCGGAVLVVDLAAREGVLLAGHHEASAANAVEGRAGQQLGQ
jgi:hypothetical protein